MGMLMLFM